MEWIPAYVGIVTGIVITRLDRVIQTADRYIHSRLDCRIKSGNDDLLTISKNSKKKLKYIV